jgi:hypothetical protein
MDMNEKPKRPDPHEQQLIEQLEAALKPRLRLTDKPPDGFDPLEASTEELDKFGLPPRPHPEAHPEAYAHWRRLLSKPLVILPAVFPVFKTLDYRITGYVAKKKFVFAMMDHHETSSNWSGAFITANERGPFFMVFGSWIVPTPTRPAFGADGDYRSSTWMGLDGVRRHSRALPQLGTTQRVTVAGGVSTPMIEAWWQWWIRGANFPPVPIDPNFVVAAGDQVMCLLFVLAPDRVGFFIKNVTQGGALAHADAKLPPVSGIAPSELFVRGAHAEWIEERPMKLGSNDLYPLADYGTVTFSDCLGVVPVEARDLSGARLLRMVEERKNQHRSAIISSAKKIPPTQRVLEARYRYEGT